MTGHLEEKKKKTPKNDSIGEKRPHPVRKETEYFAIGVTFHINVIKKLREHKGEDKYLAEFT